VRIGIDARELVGRPTGVGRYLAELLRHWSRPASGVIGTHDLLLYCQAPLSPAVASSFAGLQATIRVVTGSGGTWWEQVSLPAAANIDRLDLFFAPAYTAPFRVKCPVVVTIHDLSYFAHPEWFRPREGLRRRTVTRWSARRAALILTDSLFSQTEVERHLGVPPLLTRVIPLGASMPACLDSSSPVPRLEGKSDSPSEPGSGPFVLYVGSVFNRRRLPELIASFPFVIADMPGARLEIIGENRTFPHQDLSALIRHSGLEDRIGLSAYVSDEALAQAYGRASVFVFLSEYEGFGLTPLEALACGIPVVLRDTPVAREVCGPAALYVAPDDPHAVAAAILSLLRDSHARRAILDAAPGVLSRYSWAKAARMTMDALESVGR
jgi:glycosyltransferase involved in cell wall biosynthesis